MKDRSAISIGLRIDWEFELSIFGQSGTHLYQECFALLLADGGSTQSGRRRSWVWAWRSLSLVLECSASSDTM